MEKRLTNWISRVSFLLIFVLSTAAGLAQDEEGSDLGFDGDIENGKQLFNSNCASCHKLDKKAIGPALGDVTERRELDWLIKWIQNNQELRASGDQQAIEVFEEYNGSVMPAFPGLSEQDIKDILVYTTKGGKKKAPPAEGAEVAVAAEDAEADNTTLLIILGALLLFMIVLLARVKNTLKAVRNEPTSTVLEDANIITRAALKNSKVITLLTIVIAVVFLSELYAGLSAIGVSQNYQPTQPIAFSHALHAGENQIDCNYCHYGARKGKHSNIPSAGVCMNCHMQVQEGQKTGTEEIAKIYAAVGWDPETYTYIEDYDTKPIEWVRIHNLPDLAYFNHAQHVNAGQLACQTCHGPIQEMEEVYQYSPLTMGWCINCHRETQVQVESNDYYEQMHTKLKEKYGEDAEITVEMIGGLECGKCHY